MSEVEIQCPICGGMLQNLHRLLKEWSCNQCGTAFTEEEIYKRCGL